MSNEAQAWARVQTVGGCGRKAVLMALANRADESWSCYPGQELIARETEQTSRTVRSHLEALEADGYIRREERRRQDGYRTSDRYYLLPETVSGELSDLTGNERGPHRKLTQTSPETVSGQETSVEPTVETTDSSSRPTHDEVTADFDDFWARYPRRVAKGQALKAYRAARKKTDHHTIIKAVTRYPFDRERPQFIPHPATWLNGERWTDETATNSASEHINDQRALWDAGRLYA